MLDWLFFQLGAIWSSSCPPFGKQTYIYMTKESPKVFEKHVFVCVSGKTCPQEGALEVFDALRKEIFERGLKSKIRINKSGCFDQCGNGPMIVVYPDQVWYAKVKVEDLNEIVEEHLLANRPVERLFYDGSGRKACTR